MLVFLLLSTAALCGASPAPPTELEIYQNYDLYRSALAEANYDLRARTLDPYTLFTVGTAGLFLKALLDALSTRINPNPDPANANPDPANANPDPANGNPDPANANPPPEAANRFDEVAYMAYTLVNTEGVDVNADGLIDRNEFGWVFPEVDLYEGFGYFDANNDGFISIDEL